MSRRDEVLVSTDWVAEHAQRPGLPPGARSTRTPPLMRAGTSPARSRGTGRTTCTTRCGATSSIRASLSELLARSGVANDTTVVLYGDNNNWFATYAYWLLQLLRTRRREAHGRRAQDVGARGPRARDRRADDPARHRTTAPAVRRQRSAPSATTCSSTSAARAASMVDVRSPAEYTGEMLAQPHLPQEQAQARRPHPRRRERALGQSGATRTARSRPPTNSRPLRGCRRRRPTPTIDRLLPHRRALEPHLVRAARAPRLRATCATTTARGPSTATSSECRSSGSVRSG